MSKARKAGSEQLRDRLIALHREREQQKTAHRRPRPHRLTPAERTAIRDKTNGMCHICGGDIEGSWHADHVMAHSAGGKHSVDNYLPAHPTCNNYRWDYLAEEFELILELGVWARTQVEKGNEVGIAIAQGFSKYEAARIRRRSNLDDD